MALGILGAITGVALVVLVLSLIVGAFFIWLSAKIFKMKDKTFATPFIISLISVVVGWVLTAVGMVIPGGKYLMGIVIMVFTIWLIKTKYKTNWVKGLLIWIVSAVLAWLVMLVISMVFLGGAVMTFAGMSLG